MDILRVFPQRTSYTPDDDMVFIGMPPLIIPECGSVRQQRGRIWKKERVLKILEHERIDKMTERTRLINIIEGAIGDALPLYVQKEIVPKIADRLIKEQAEQARREAEPGEIKEIKITYKDGGEKLVSRGVCFSVYEKGDAVYVSCDGLAGSERDEAAVLAIVSRIAKELGISDEPCEKAEVTDNA